MRKRILIAHRGNVNGEVPELENSPIYVRDALYLGFNIEIDVWSLNKNFYLGHDKVTYHLSLNDMSLLQDKRTWCHAKNVKALSDLLQMGAQCFWHQNDDVVLTSNGYIWSLPTSELYEKSIIVELGVKSHHVGKSYGICSDFIATYQ